MGTSMKSHSVSTRSGTLPANFDYDTESCGAPEFAWNSSRLPYVVFIAFLTRFRCVVNVAGQIQLRFSGADPLASRIAGLDVGRDRRDVSRSSRRSSARALDARL